MYPNLALTDSECLLSLWSLAKVGRWNGEAISQLQVPPTRWVFDGTLPDLELCVVCGASTFCHEHHLVVMLL